MRSIDFKVWGSREEVRKVLAEVRRRLLKEEIDAVLPMLAALHLPGPRRGGFLWLGRRCRDCGDKVGRQRMEEAFGHYNFCRCHCGWVWAEACFHGEEKCK